MRPLDGITLLEASSASCSLALRLAISMAGRIAADLGADVVKLEDGDVILAIDGREPSSGSHATRILSSYQSGEKITIKLMRQQKTVNVETTLPERMSFMGSGRDRRVRLIRKDATT